MKYAKWKAVEIDRCLKNGIPPTPGPPGGNEEDLELQFGGVGPPAAGFTVGPSDTQFPSPKPVPKPRQNIPRPTLQEGGDGLLPGVGGASNVPPVAPSVSVGPVEIVKAQKLCKFASSALDYEDIPGAIDYLDKAKNLLTRGKED